MGNQPVAKMAAACLEHLEEESTERDEEVESKDPDSIDGVTEGFMVHLVRTVKDAKWRRSTAIIAAAMSTLSATAH